jgi:hypothetical protein
MLTKYEQHCGEKTPFCKIGLARSGQPGDQDYDSRLGIHGINVRDLRRFHR